MACLLIPLVGPMQSWGTRSRFQNRDTEREPTFSGVSGVVAAALGIGREDDLSPFSGLSFHLRADREGKLMKDFQTAQNVAKASKGTENLISDRYFLQDAAFLACMEGDAGFLKRAHFALADPKWFLFLGRRSYVPSLPLYLSDGFHEEASPMELFKVYPLVGEPRKSDSGRQMIRCVMETDDPAAEFRNDRPVSFRSNDRRYERRYVKMEYLDADDIPRGALCT